MPLNSVLITLGDGRWHATADLRRATGLDEAAVTAALRQARAAGLPLAEAGDRWRWTGAVEPLAAEAIRAAVPAAARPLLRGLDVYGRIDSTNEALRRLPRAALHGRACLAECQTRGRGRRGRAWLSPPAANLYLSLGWRYALPATALAGLSLAVGVAAAAVLRRWSDGAVGVKWPNDLFIGPAKLGGVLIELLPQGAGVAVIVGLGVNLAMPRDGVQPDQPWTRLAEHCPPQRLWQRNRLAGELLGALLTLLRDYPDGGAERLHAAWSAYDLVRGRPVRVLAGEACYNGQAEGIDAQFRLRLRCGDRVMRFDAGEVSLRW